MVLIELKDGTLAFDFDLIYSENSLWQGNLLAATNLEFLEKNKINHILTVNSVPLSKKIYAGKNILIKYIKVDDMQNSDLLSDFDDAYDFIDKGLKKSAVLVHCLCGISRSSTIVISYIMKKKNWTLKQSFDYCKSRWDSINPNPSFMAQLKLYQYLCCKVDKNDVIYKMYRWHTMINLGTKLCDIQNIINFSPESYSFHNSDQGNLKCKKCRQILANEANVLFHMPKQKFNWHNDTNILENKNIEKEIFCKDSIYVEPLPWMENIFKNDSGKLLCSNLKCKQKIGCFNWFKGCKCSCGTNIYPGFKLTSSKIDS